MKRKIAFIFICAWALLALVAWAGPTTSGNGRPLIFTAWYYKDGAEDLPTILAPFYPYARQDLYTFNEIVYLNQKYNDMIGDTRWPHFMRKNRVYIEFPVDAANVRPLRHMLNENLALQVPQGNVVAKGRIFPLVPNVHAQNSYTQKSTKKQRWEESARASESEGESDGPKLHFSFSQKVSSQNQKFYLTQYSGQSLSADVAQWRITEWQGKMSLVGQEQENAIGLEVAYTPYVFAEFPLTPIQVDQKKASLWSYTGMYYWLWPQHQLGLGLTHRNGYFLAPASDVLLQSEKFSQQLVVIHLMQKIYEDTRSRSQVQLHIRYQHHLHAQLAQPDLQAQLQDLDAYSVNTGITWVQPQFFTPRIGAQIGLELEMKDTDLHLQNNSNNRSWSYREHEVQVGVRWGINF